jgi:chromosome partitioning protein
MAKSSQEVSRFDAKSTIRDEEASSTSAILGHKPLTFPENPGAPKESKARVISIVNQKGGVGKTTTTINLGAALAEMGRRVLLIDFDSQASMTSGLGIGKPAIDEQHGSIWHLLNDLNEDVRGTILKSSVPGLDFIRGHYDLAGADSRFASEIAKELMLRKILTPILTSYDDILIDCSPSLGTLTVNALTASDGVIIPMECEFFAVLGLQLVTTTIEKIKAAINPHLQVYGILATMFERKTAHSKDVLELISGQFPDLLLDTVIARTVRFSESTVKGQPITTFASSSAGAHSYRRLARELIVRGGAN